MFTFVDLFESLSTTLLKKLIVDRFSRKLVSKWSMIKFGTDPDPGLDRPIQDEFFDFYVRQLC